MPKKIAGVFTPTVTKEFCADNYPEPVTYIWECPNCGDTLDLGGYSVSAVNIANEQSKLEQCGKCGAIVYVGVFDKKGLDYMKKGKKKEDAEIMKLLRIKVIRHGEYTPPKIKEKLPHLIQKGTRLL